MSSDDKKNWIQMPQLPVEVNTDISPELKKVEIGTWLSLLSLTF
jgi:hypothetical protein